jgi:hypothetical protein
VGPDRSAPTWPELLDRARRDGLPGLVSVTWGSGELAELLSMAVEALLAEEVAHAHTASARSALRDLVESRGLRIDQLEAALRVIREQRVAVDDGPRQELAQIRALVGEDHPTPIAVALEVGAARALRARP